MEKRSKERPTLEKKGSRRPTVFSRVAPFHESVDRGIDEIDRKILNRFFTNVDDNVFVARDLPPEVWALFQARYSRSTAGLRESFIELLRDSPEEYKLLRDLAESGQLERFSIKSLERLAEQFMKKWYIEYSHESIAEGAVIGIGVENVSILATKIIERARLSSFTEKSTRYVKFKQGMYYTDPNIESSEYADEYHRVMHLLFKTYEELQEPVLEYIKTITDKEQFDNRGAWLRACKARRFDALRYLLPASTLTSFGWTVNARECSYTLSSKLYASRLYELRVLAEKLHRELRKVVPTLMLNTSPSDYVRETEQKLYEMVNRHVGSVVPDADETNSACLVHGPDPVFLEKMITASLMYRYTRNPVRYADIAGIVDRMSSEERRTFYAEVMKRLTRKDHPLRELEHVYFTFELTLDYGAFRDIQRHRMTTQTEQPLTTFLGYDVPEDVANAGKEYEEKFRFAMDEARRLFEKMYVDMPDEAQYVVPLGFRKRVLITLNLRELFYVIRLRSSKQGHPSYRRIAQQMYREIEKRYPWIAEFLVCDFDEHELGRYSAEARKPY